MLVREARRLGYPARLIWLSFATYRLQRVLRVGPAVSDPIQATTGITTGAGTATTEMRLVMIDIDDSALLQHPSVTPTLYDLSAESAAVAKHVKQHLVGFVQCVCLRIARDCMEASVTKSALHISTWTRPGAPFFL